VVDLARDWNVSFEKRNERFWCVTFSVKADEVAKSVDVATKVAIQESAAAQLRYARSLVRAIPVPVDAEKRREVALHAFTALQVVKAKWPDDAKANAEPRILKRTLTPAR
jgi:hypothetical protein